MQNSPARSNIDVGSVIADTYTVEALIGRGGMGVVFLASHNRLPGKKVAIKMLHAELADAEVLARFKREAQIASQLGHPNIVAVHDINALPDGTPYMLLEYLQGETLAHRIENGPLSQEQMFSIARQVGSALAAAHKEGIVHRDLKPQNIFLVPTEVDGRTVEIAKVLDFGISKMRGSQTVKTQDSALLGTPQYMAPEQATGQQGSVDQRTDIFAFGAILYEMASGQPAFSGASIPEVVFKVVYEQPPPLPDSVPATIKAVIAKAMAKKQDERYASITELIEELTGTPLTTGRNKVVSVPPPEGGFAIGSRVRSTGKEAFDKTIGSGDHGVAPVSGVGATQGAVSGIEATQASVRGSAPTLASQNQPAPPQRSSKGLVIGAVIAAAAIAAGAMYFVMRGHDEPAPVATTEREPRHHERHEPSEMKTEPAKTEPAKTEPTKTEPTKTEPTKVEPPRTEAVKPATKPEAKKPPEPKKPVEEPVDDAAGDETARQKLQQADAALGKGDYQRAELFANSVINSDTAAPAQKMRAHAIRGEIQCTAHNNEETARIDLKSLTRAPRLRRKVIDACHAVGLLRADQ